MQSLIDSLRWAHVIAGFLGLAAFWVPVFAKKGGTVHKTAGKVFKYCAYLVTLGAMVSVGLHMSRAIGDGYGPANDPGQFAFLVFLGYLAFVTFVSVFHGVNVLEHKKDITEMNTGFNRLLARLCVFSSVGLIGYALYFQPEMKIVLFALSPIGFGTGFGILRAIGGKRTESKTWFYEHMGAMLGTGIAFHTAFMVFGSRSLFDLGLTGWVAIVPWILPAAIGIPAIEIWTRYYKRRFGDLPSKTTPVEEPGSA